MLGLITLMQSFVFLAGTYFSATYIYRRVTLFHKSLFDRTACNVISNLFGSTNGILCQWYLLLTAPAWHKLLQQLDALAGLFRYRPSRAFIAFSCVFLTTFAVSDFILRLSSFQTSSALTQALANIAFGVLGTMAILSSMTTALLVVWISRALCQAFEQNAVRLALHLASDGVKSGDILRLKREYFHLAGFVSSLDGTISHLSTMYIVTLAFPICFNVFNILRNSIFVVLFNTAEESSPSRPAVFMVSLMVVLMVMMMVMIKLHIFTVVSPLHCDVSDSALPIFCGGNTTQFLGDRNTTYSGHCGRVEWTSIELQSRRVRRVITEAEMEITDSSISFLVNTIRPPNHKNYLYY